MTRSEYAANQLLAATAHRSPRATRHVQPPKAHWVCRLLCAIGLL